MAEKVPDYEKVIRDQFALALLVGLSGVYARYTDADFKLAVERIYKVVDIMMEIRKKYNP